jgi:hypothetical protein
MGFLSKMGVQVKNFGAYVQETTERLKQASLERALELQRPIKHLRSPKTSKEELAREIARQDDVREGLICVFTAVEPCWSYEIHKNRGTGERELTPTVRQCLHLYHYWMHEVFGFMHARIQTWFPFSIQICVNGREWLAQQMDLQGMKYRRVDNCFTWLEDIAASQQLMNQFVELPWVSLLHDFRRRVHPAHEDIFEGTWNDYYWTIQQSEWATDILFRSAEALNRIYPALIRGAIVSFSCDDVIRFFGRKAHGNFSPEIQSEYKRLPEGLRVKHWMGVNSEKLYNKGGNILRPEITINDPSVFKVFASPLNHPDAPPSWRPMRKTVCDIKRRAQVSQAANERYLDALASIDTNTPLRQLVEPLCRPIRWNKQRVRALRPWTAEDSKLLQAINRGEYAINGFRNRDILAHLYPETTDQEEKKSLARALGRKFRMLRAHRIIHKLPHTHRYQITPKGRNVLAAILQSQEVTLHQLNKAAA